MKKRFTPKEKQEILKKYKSGKYNAVQIAKEYNATNSGILKLVRRMGYLVPADQSKLQRKYTLNTNYFDAIDNEHKAYWLGFLYADGYNSEIRGTIKLALQARDKEILIKFKKDLNCNNPLKLILTSKKNPKWQDTYSLTICNRKISTNLAQLGCYQSKSLTLQFPTSKQVPKYLLNHFIRGMWDGDGSINTCGGSLVSTIMFCDKLKLILNNLKVTYKIDNICNKQNQITKTLRLTGGRVNALKLYDWLYRDATVYLQRKYEKYIIMKDKQIKNPK